MGYNETLYNTTELMAQINTDGYFVGVMKVFNSQQYTFGLFQHILMILFFVLFVTALRQKNVSYIRCITAGTFVTLIISTLLMIMGVVDTSVIVIWTILFIAGLIYQKLNKN